MGKAKKRRENKDLEKLWRAGRYKDWVLLVSQADQVRHYQAQWQEAWRHLSRLALRLPGQVKEFWHLLASQPQAPNLPDVVFLRGLQDVCAGSANPTELAGLAGLSPPAQLLRDRLASWAPETFPGRKISRLLTALTQQPDKVSGKIFNDLAALVRPNPWSDSLLALGKTINQIRKLNHRGGFNPHLPDVGQTALREADDLLSHLAQTWNPTIRGVLLYPFCHQLWKCCQGLWVKRDFGHLLYISTLLPFLFSETFGPEGVKLQEYCRQNSEEFFSETEEVAFLEQSWSNGVDGMALALGKTRRLLKTGLIQPSHRFLAKFRATYIRFCKEIQRVQPDLSPREKSDLVRLLDPILFEDRQWFEDDERYFLEFINLALATGAAGARICLLGLLSPELDSHPTLRRQAREILQQFPYPGDRLIEEILLEPQLLPFPEIHRIKTLLEVYPEQVQLRQLIADNICTSLNALLLTSAIGVKFEKSQRHQEDMLLAFRQGMQTFSHSLAKLQEYREFEPLQDLAASFPEGYYTPEGYLDLLQRLYDRSQDLEQLLTHLDRHFNVADLMDFMDFPFMQFFATGWIESHETLLWQFINEHMADLTAAPLDSLRRLAEKVFSQEGFSEPETSFLIRLSSLLQQRLEAGETAAEPLYDEIVANLMARRKTGSQRRRRK